MRTLITTYAWLDRNEEQLEIIADGYVHYQIDNNYGADADGNRGTQKVIITSIENVAAYLENMKQIEISPVEKDIIEEALAKKFFSEGIR